MLQRFNWYAHDILLSHAEVMWYLFPQIEGNVKLVSDASHDLNQSLEQYSDIFYSVGLAKTLVRLNVSEEETLQIFKEDFKIVYTTGFSLLVER